MDGSLCKGKDSDRVVTFIGRSPHFSGMKVLAAVMALSLILALPLVPAAASAQEYPEIGVAVDAVAENLTVPWSIDWLPDGTILFTERGGDLRTIQNGTLVPEPLVSVQGSSAEGGMLGVAVDPDFGENGHIYIYYTYSEFFSTANKVVRYQLADGVATEDGVLIEEIPGGAVHNGGRIQFGPDQKLYIATGDAGDPRASQDPDSLAGKILRINPDGTIPGDNPYGDSPVWSIGHRNPQGMDWDESGNMVATEHGPSGERGFAHDEINVITPGTNYGWPETAGGESADGMQTPILHTGFDTWAPSGAEFYDGHKIPEWTGKYFVATLRGSHLHVIDLDLESGTVASHEKLFEGEFGRIRDVQTGPDGFLYLLTSNRDGRGFPAPNDDRILRITPLYEDKQHTTGARHLEYDHKGEMLDASVQYVGYDISPIRFDLDSKSISFDFARSGNADPTGSQIKILIERPLISPPYSIQVESEAGTVWHHDEPDVEITGDNFYSYDLAIDGTARTGTVTVTGTYVVPEFGAVMLAVMAAGLIPVALWSGSRHGLWMRG